MQLIDSHCHLDDSRFDDDRDAVIGRAEAAGVTRFVVAAIRRAGWPKLARLAETTPSIRPAFGLHPWFCDEHRPEDLDALPAFLERAVAVGECGLDLAPGRASEAEQLAWFRAQLQLAREHQLPIIVHAYKAIDVVQREIRRLPGLTGVVHGFAGSRQQATALVELGFYLGFGTAVCRPEAQRLRKALQSVPAERLLLESDAPDQPGPEHRGERNEPAYLVATAAAIATIRAVDLQTLAAQCNRNAEELFKL